MSDDGVIVGVVKIPVASVRGRSVDEIAEILHRALEGLRGELIVKIGLAVVE